MKYLSVREYALLHGMSERTVRNYCAVGKLSGAFLVGKSWSIPEDAPLPLHNKSKNISPILIALREQKEIRMRGGIYHRTQIDLTYNSNHIEGSCLTHEQTRHIYETNLIGATGKALNVDDIVETLNHFRCVDFIIDRAEEPLSEAMIKTIHQILKANTQDSTKEWFVVGDYKKLSNEVGGNETTSPERVHAEMKRLIASYNAKKNRTFDDILDFHVRFERIHPFQDGNGRVGRLLLFKECLANNHVPFIITDNIKFYYYRGLQEWPSLPGYLRDTCLAAQDKYKSLLAYFHIKY